MNYLSSLSRSRWLVIILGVVLMLSIAFAWLTRPGVLSRRDFSPFSSQKESDAFYKQHPLMRMSAPDKARFSYQPSVGPDKQAVYKVTLWAPALKPNNEASAHRYVEELKTSQSQAQDWMKSLEDIAQAYVIWSPDPAKVTAPATTPPPLPKK